MDKSPLPLSKRRKLDGVVEDDDVGCLRSSVKECIIHASPDKKKKLRALLVANVPMPMWGMEVVHL